MNRKEVIAVTVIINVILLSVLFFMASRIDDEIAPSPEIASVPIYEKLLETKESSVTLAAKPRTVQETPVDEVDTVLRDFAAAVAASHQQKITKVEEPVPHLPPQVPNPPSPPVAPIKNASYPSSQNMVEIIVKRGDFLQKIANQNGSTVEAIKMANNLKNDQLKVGQVLRIPLISRPETIAMAAPRLSENTPGTYKVKSGDSPWKIAKQFNVNAEEILRLNNLDENTAKNLKPGDVIRVPQ